MSSRELFAKMAASLDSNRKIQEGGRNAREVYLWVLRQVALRNSDGDIPLDDVTCYRHVARQLMCSEAEARDGFERCVTVALLREQDDRCVVVGWCDDWSRRAMTGAERVAKHRSRKAKQTAAENVPVTKRYHVTESVTGNAREKNRIEEIREEEETDTRAAPVVGLFDLATTASAPKPDPAAELAAHATSEINRVTGRHFDPSSAATRKLCRALLRDHRTPADVTAVVEAKAKEWLGGDMAERVCPGTLLARSNFARYIDEIQAGPVRAASRPQPANRGPVTASTIARTDATLTGSDF